MCVASRSSCHARSLHWLRVRVTLDESQPLHSGSCARSRCRVWVARLPFRLSPFLGPLDALAPALAGFRRPVSATACRRRRGRRAQRRLIALRCCGARGHGSARVRSLLLRRGNEKGARKREQNHHRFGAQRIIDKRMGQDQRDRERRRTGEKAIDLEPRTLVATPPSTVAPAR